MNTIETSKKIFLLGIKGAAMANIALILKKMGKEVTGSDKDEEFITDEQLQKNSIPIIHSFESSAVPSGTDLIIYSAAHGGINNPQILEAQKRKITIMHQAEFLGELLGEFQESIAVCGTHGKTTTSAMLSYCLLQLKANPSYLVGASSFNGYYGGDYNGKDYFVIEADEYGVNPPLDTSPKFHFLHPNFCIATNIDFDHPDVYSDIQATKEAFAEFFNQILDDSLYNKLFLCHDDADLMDVAAQLPRKSYETYGFDPKADLHISNVLIDENTSKFNLIYKSQDIGEFTISLFGGNHILNASGVILLLIHLGFKADDIRKAIVGFTGAKRRFELVKKIGSTYLFDDYAHHPEEIKTTLEMAKNRFKNKRIIAIFQPHTFSRTEALKDQFVDALSIADEVILSPIFASAREKKSNTGITSVDLVNLAKNKSYNHFDFYETRESFQQKLKAVLKSGDVVCTMGAGDVYKLKNDIIEILHQL